MHPEHARFLIFHEGAKIKTMVLEKGCVEARSELRGEKRVSLKPPINVPAIVWSREIHSPWSYHEKELVLAKQSSGSAFRIGIWSPPEVM
jgi:hypothetical protein